MKNIYFFLLLFNCALNSVLHSEYQKNPLVKEEMWNLLEPHFIPEDHPAKIGLDKLFKNQNFKVIKNETSVKKAGFANAKLRKFSSMIASSHPKIPGYFFKFYPEDSLGVDDSFLHWRRISGANSIRMWIDANYPHLFKVPKKWLYLLPEDQQDKVRIHNFILVAEDMELVSGSRNLTKWKSSQLPESTVKAVFLLLRDLGLKDSIFPFNLPFAKDGKIAVIDTEYHHQWPVHYPAFQNYFSRSNRLYWKKLIETNGMEK